MSKIGPHNRKKPTPKPVLRNRFDEIVADKEKQGLVTRTPLPELITEHEKEKKYIFQFKCSACGSTHYTERRKDNGIIGSGHRSWVSELICACGLKYDPGTFSKKPQVE